MGDFKPLKLWFDQNLAESLAERISPRHTGFDRHTFVREVAENIPDQELKQRVATFTVALARQLPRDYPSACALLGAILGPENDAESGMFTNGYWLMPIAHYVEKYGLEHFDQSLALIEEITKRHTGEYAIRPYLIAQPKQTLRRMARWSKSPNVHVRRLASEGLRPRLPWAKKTTLFSADPSPVIAILVNLKSDRSAFVRKSVANCLNDFPKENYEYTIDIIRDWRVGAGPQTRWIIKHALRNELKKKNPDAMQLVD